MYEEMVQRVLRKCMFLLLCLFVGGATAHATRVYADLSKGQAVGNSTWDSGTNTFAWTASTYASMELPGLAGDMRGMTLVLEIEMNQNQAFRVDLQPVGKDWVTNQEGTVFYTPEETKSLVLDNIYTPEQLENVKAIRVNTASGSGSVVLKSVYLEKPFELTFDDLGKAYIYPSDMEVSGMTLDPQTGVLTKEVAGDANLTVNLDDVDFSNVTNITVNVDATTAGYTDLFSCTIVRSLTEQINAWYYSKYGIDYAEEGKDYQARSQHIKEIVMAAKSEATGSMKINSICITKSVVNALLGNETCLKDLPFYVKQPNGTFSPGGIPVWNMNVETAEVYGDCSQAELCESYANLDAYDEIRIYQTTGENCLRFWFFNESNDGFVTIFPEIVEGLNYSVIDIESVKDQCGGKAWLIGAKSDEWGNQNHGSGKVTITNIAVTDPNAKCDYVLSGYGELNANAQAALADANATLIDARGITKSMELVSANPNCLFLVNDASMLPNTKNVVVEKVTGMDTTYACEKLELQAGNPFRTPYAFTATLASTAKTVSEFGTLVLPYAVDDLPGGCEAYQLTGVENGRVTGEPLQAIDANSPVLLVGEGDCAFEASGVEVAATPAEARLGALTGVYARITAPRGSYVLQNQPEVAGVAFYHVKSDAVRVNPFTAYLTDAVANAANQNALAIDLNGGVTAVEGVEAAADATVVAIYDLSGRQLDRMAKGVNVVKLSDGTVKKVIVK